MRRGNQLLNVILHPTWIHPPSTVTGISSNLAVERIKPEQRRTEKAGSFDDSVAVLCECPKSIGSFKPEGKEIPRAEKERKAKGRERQMQDYGID